jgi:hypothetical protein
MAWRGEIKTGRRARLLIGDQASVSDNSTRTNFLSGTSENSGRKPSDFRLFTLSGLFVPKSAIQNKSQTVSAIFEMETLPLSMI